MLRRRVVMLGMVLLVGSMPSPQRPARWDHLGERAMRTPLVEDSELRLNQVVGLVMTADRTRHADLRHRDL